MLKKVKRNENFQGAGNYFPANLGLQTIRYRGFQTTGLGMLKLTVSFRDSTW
jgi:hypothetical protein